MLKKGNQTRRQAVLPEAGYYLRIDLRMKKLCLQQRESGGYQVILSGARDHSCRRKRVNKRLRRACFTSAINVATRGHVKANQLSSLRRFERSQESPADTGRSKKKGKVKGEFGDVRRSSAWSGTHADRSDSRKIVGVSIMEQGLDLEKPQEGGGH